jgi:enamine deaminase RidA (YjgF/YER057c/UK114 family)
LIDSDVHLPDEGRLLSFGRVHQTGFYGARAWFVYKQLSDYLSAYGSKMADVVHQTIYVCDPTQFPEVERAASLFYGSTLPPTTVIPINDTSPFRQANLEIEVITHEDKG